MHPQALEYLKWVASLNEPSFINGATPAEIRAARRKRTPLPMEDVHRTENHSANGVPVRVYWPIKSDALLPALVWYHGGGWVLGDLDAYDSCCRTLANASAAVVVSVDYRLGPEHIFPAGVDDCITATKWVHENASKLGIRAGWFVCFDVRDMLKLTFIFTQIALLWEAIQQVETSQLL